jgi:hypothetical protein
VSPVDIISVDLHNLVWQRQSLAPSRSMHVHTKYAPRATVAKTTVNKRGAMAAFIPARLFKACPCHNQAGTGMVSSRDCGDESVLLTAHNV